LVNYKPRAFTGGATLPSFVSYVQSELQSVSRASGGSVPFIQLETLYAEPDKPREGMQVLADGSSWNPGGGKGPYIYFDGAWHKQTT
jgi:hypothetical protein